MCDKYDWEQTKVFDWWDENGDYHEVTIKFGIEQSRYYDDDGEFYYHQAYPMEVSVYSDDGCVTKCDKETAMALFGEKQLTEWIERVEQKMDELYGVVEE